MPVQLIDDHAPDKPAAKLEHERIFLAIFDRKEDEYGDLHFGIVVTLLSGTPTLYHATNSDRAHPSRGTWSFEKKGAGNGWDILQSESLLVLLKLQTPNPWGAHASIGDLLRIFKDEPIPTDGQTLVLIEEERFSCRSWVQAVMDNLYVIEVSPVSGKVALDQGSEFARQYRKELRESGKAVEAGRFRLAELEAAS